MTPRLACIALATAASLAVQASKCEAETTADTLRSILKAFDDRNNSVEASQAWLKTPRGREEAAFLADHFDDLQDLRKAEVPAELARTGMVEVVSLVAKALANRINGLEALPGIFYACNFGEPDKPYREALAPLVVPLIGKGSVPDHDAAIEVLPLLDKELAARTLFTERFLAPRSPFVETVLSSCNDAGVKVPVNFIHALLDEWKSTGLNPQSPSRIQAGYREVIRALAAHNPQEAENLMESIVQKHPDQAGNFSEVVLACAGLTRLYDGLCSYAEDPATFASLPEEAKIYFSVVAFSEDSANGGFGQALDNSTGDYLPWVKKGYQAIGDAEALRFLDWMCKPFGVQGPSADQGKRRAQMEEMKPAYAQQEEHLRESWVPDPKEGSQISTLWLLNRYAARNAAILKPFLGGVKRERSSNGKQ